MTELPILDGEEAPDDEITPWIVVECVRHDGWMDCQASWVDCLRYIHHLPVPRIGDCGLVMPLVRRRWQ